MTTDQIANDIARGIEIRAEIATLEAELKAIETRLKNAAENGPHIPLQDAEREGKQFPAMGRSRIVPIRFESDLIAASFEPDSTMRTEIEAVTGEHFPRFYAVSNKFARVPKDGDALRKLARQLLTPEKFALLIRAATTRNKDGIAKSRVVVAWADAKPLDQAATL